MPTFTVKIKWGQESYDKIEVDTDEEPIVFKAQLFALTGVEPHRQKVILKGAVLKDDPAGWDPLKTKLKNGVTLLMMGTKEEDIVVAPKEKPQFLEDMDESELQSAMQLPAGLTNLGNTCYMNATVQCLKSVPEFKEALKSYRPVGAGGLGVGDAATQLTVSMRDLYKAMERGQNFPPLVLLQVLHNAFPRFAERGEQGGYQQQDANECWVELMGMIKQKLMSKPNEAEAAKSVVDQYFGLEFATETKCAETEDEPVIKSTEKFLQYSCYIDKEVKYLASGLKNRLQESITKKSPSLDRDAEYVKSLKVSRLPGYLTVQMMRFQYKQKDAVNAKILKDIKFPLILDTFDLCTEELQQKLIPLRNKFKDHEDRVVESAGKLKGGMGKEAALKKDREAAEASPDSLEPYSFEDDVGSNNSGYYELQAVLTHKGRSSNSGHYVAWVRYRGDSWTECNDDTINPLHVDDVMKLSGGGDWHTAYILLYGPRKLLKYEAKPEKETAQEPESVASNGSGSKAEEKMET